MPGADPVRILEDIAAEREQDAAFKEAVSQLETGIYLFGHSHIQWSYQAKERKVYLINPGSCGLPLDGIRNSIPYTVLEITKDGQVNIEEKRIPFDKTGYARSFMQTGQYREAGVWSKVILREWMLAREHIHYFLAFTEQFAKDIGDDRRPYSLETWESAFEIWNKQQSFDLV